MTRKIANAGLLTALAIIFSFIEMTFPINFGIPGIKLGLANVIVLVLLLQEEEKEALAINIVRVLVVGFLFGNMNSIIFSLAGAMCSYTVMHLLCRYTKLHATVVSVGGAIFHVIGQLAVGLMWYPMRVLAFYGIFLLIAAIITGFILGMVADRLKGRVFI